MKTDTYTKAILTIIAICLTVNVVKDFNIFPSAYALENTKLEPLNSVIDVRLVDINTNDKLNVNLKNIDTYDELKVNINKIDANNVLDINIKEVGGSWLTGGGAVPVQLKK